MYVQNEKFIIRYNEQIPRAETSCLEGNLLIISIFASRVQDYITFLKNIFSSLL